MVNRGATARDRVLRLLHATPEPLTKQQVADELGLSMPTVYQSLATLTDEGLVSDCGELSSTGGRRAATFSVNARGRLAAGVSVTGSELRTLVCDLRGSVVTETREPLSLRGDVRGLGRRMGETIRKLLTDEHLDEKSLLGARVTVPSVIDPQDGSIVSSPILGLANVPARDLTAGVGLPASVANDACCGGFAEWFQAPESCDLAFLSLEEGVGGAILTNGTMLEGLNGRAAEFGHLCVEPGGALCHCGRRGCLEAYCSLSCLCADAGTPARFFSRLAAGDDGARATWESYATHLARGVHDIRMVLDCDIVLGGSVAGFLGLYLDELRSRVAELDPFETDASWLRLSRHPDNAVPLGAALGVIAEFLGV